MRAEIVAVGTELLLGQIANTNAAWLSERFAEIGVDVLRHQVVGDNEERIGEAIATAASRSDVVVVMGGLGPTQDDITRPVLARVAGAELVRHPEIERELRDRFRVRGREMPEANLAQADVPEGARYITPERGTAPGLIVEVGTTRVYALPGVPAEMREMAEGVVLPELAERGGPAALVSHTLRCYGLAESRIAELLEDQFRGSSNPTVAYLAGGGEVHVRLTAKAGSRPEAESLLEPFERTARERLGDHVYGVDDESLESVMGRLLLERGATLACAESLTGGGLGERITAVPGASAYFLGSAVTYSLEAKRSVLGVSDATLQGPGPVSPECAAEMAAGARRVFGADIAAALTGVAGPDAHGGAEAGQVWIALDAEARSHQHGFRWPFDRELVRRFSELAALDLVRRHLLGLSLPG
ncbi:MAG TPA: competence/damage-inducible protein A [Actinomycetota bacterium]|nr:competence/damage-inducible protein A [Actinomycetota bacterium]